MLNTTIQTENNDHAMWAKRADFWIKRIKPASLQNTKKRKIIHKPLVLNGHGIRLNIDRSTLLIKCGFTHYPQAREEYRFFPRDKQLPSRIVILDGDGSITFDALEWLSEQNVPLLQINWRGEIINVANTDYAANHELSEYQRQILESNDKLEYAKWLVGQKIENSCSTILHLSKNNEATQTALEKLTKQQTLLSECEPESLSNLLGIEGMAAFYYFRFWQSIPLRWKGVKSKPIPQDWYSIGARNSSTAKNQRAGHPVNAILNYAYAVLENEIRSYLLQCGVDPMIGYLHASNGDRCSLVFDLIEPARPIMDRYILEFISGRTFSPDDYPAS